MGLLSIPTFHKKLCQIASITSQAPVHTPLLNELCAVANCIHHPRPRPYANIRRTLVTKPFATSEFGLMPSCVGDTFAAGVPFWPARRARGPPATISETGARARSNSKDPTNCGFAVLPLRIFVYQTTQMPRLSSRVRCGVSSIIHRCRVRPRVMSLPQGLPASWFRAWPDISKEGCTIESSKVRVQ